MYLGTSSLTPLAPITMHEMKIESTRILEPALSPYHSGENEKFLSLKKGVSHRDDTTFLLLEHTPPPMPPDATVCFSMLTCDL